MSDESPRFPAMPRLTRALRASDLERSFNSAPPPPPAEAVALLIREVIDAEYDGDGLSSVWRASSVPSARTILGLVLAQVALSDEYDSRKQEAALKASAALWAMREQDDRPPDASLDSFACIRGTVDEKGNKTSKRVPLDPAASWAQALDRAARATTLPGYCREMAQGVRNGRLRVQDLPAILDQRGRSVEEPPVPTVPAAANSIMKDGAAWRIRFGGVDLSPIPHVQGLLYVYRLLKNKDRATSVQDLESPNRPPNLSSDRVLDDEYVEKLRKRLVELREDLDKSDKIGDVAESDRLREEQVQIEEEIKGAMDKYGVRKLGDEADKCRQRVGRALATALGKIEATSSDLHAHLDRSILDQHGFTPRYAPDPLIDWEVGPDPEPPLRPPSDSVGVDEPGCDSECHKL